MTLLMTYKTTVERETVAASMAALAGGRVTVTVVSANETFTNDNISEIITS